MWEAAWSGTSLTPRNNEARATRAFPNYRDYVVFVEREKGSNLPELIRERLRAQVTASRPTVVALMLCSRSEAERYRKGAETFVDRIFFQERNPRVSVRGSGTRIRSSRPSLVSVERTRNPMRREACLFSIRLTSLPLSSDRERAEGDRFAQDLAERLR